jgi:dethiobiotin synthetase
LFGPVGVGKTHVAQALGHQAVRQGATSASPRPVASSASSPAVTRTAPGTSACANSSALTCSSSTTSPCAS